MCSWSFHFVASFLHPDCLPSRDAPHNILFMMLPLACRLTQASAGESLALIRSLLRGLFDRTQHFGPWTNKIISDALGYCRHEYSYLAKFKGIVLRFNLCRKRPNCESGYFHEELKRWLCTIETWGFRWSVRFSMHTNNEIVSLWRSLEAIYCFTNKTIDDDTDVVHKPIK